MAISVTELQNLISAIVDQSSEASTEGGDDWNLRLKYLNLAQTEANELYDWKYLYKEYNMNVSTSTGNTSIALPADYKKLGGYPVIGGTQYEEVRAQEHTAKLSTDKFVYFLGNPGDNYTMIVNGALSSGTSVYVPYYSSGSSLASGIDVSMVPDPNYLIYRSVAWLWEAREDDRFPQAKAQAERILQRMLERENVFSEANNDESMVRTVEETKYSHRIGRD